MSCCLTSSSAGAASTDARRGLLVALGEVARIERQHIRSSNEAAPHTGLANLQSPSFISVRFHPLCPP